MWEQRTAPAGCMEDGMNRTRRLDQRYRHLLYGGLAVSAGIHMALLGLRFAVPVLPADVPMQVASIDPDPFEAMEVVPVEALLSQPAGASLQTAPAGPIADAAPAAPSRSAAASASASAPPVPAPIEAEVAFEELTVFDPLSQAEIRPVVFTDLSVAVVELPVDSDLNGEAEDDVEVYVPGSIGAAKRQWSGSVGTATMGGSGGIRIFGGGGSGGHCPMPGGRAAPPIWK